MVCTGSVGGTWDRICFTHSPDGHIRFPKERYSICVVDKLRLMEEGGNRSYLVGGGGNPTIEYNIIGLLIFELVSHG